MNSRTMWLLGAGLLCLAGAVFAAGTQGLAETSQLGANPNPVRPMRPPVAPLSAMAQLGKEIFYDASLSSSGALSCASCHSPDHAYGPPNDGPVMLGGAALSRQGARAVPSLTYLDRHPNFSIGPDKGDDDNVIDLAQMAAIGQQAARTTKTAGGSGASANIVPQGGLFWDGRADTLQDQALFPLLDPNEMDGGSAEIVADKLRRAPYANRFVELFGAGVLGNQRLLIAEAMFAVARYQVEEVSFHPYTSKYDYWLEGKARLSESELRGLQMFNDPDKANCAGCHTSAPTRDGLPPLFTDHQYEALGAPRNAALAGNRDPNHFDLGVCGPQRTDIPEQTQYCGMFLTPTLRNTATRHAFFHNGVFSTLEQVLDSTIFATPIRKRFFRAAPTARCGNTTTCRKNIMPMSTSPIRPSIATPATSRQ
ncbi:cytochrome c peroxidase [Bradyrhizobium sp. S3.2.12]|uniref:cytochrome-c peroxidase n=1 Tax=Bradyrhizobium sp. S3.2.12 TaxID=3156387 RepID=UPI003392BCEC